MKKRSEGLIVRGTGDVFADLGFDDAPLMRMKAKLANEIAKALDGLGVPLRAAAQAAGATAADLSRIRHADLDRFTLDRLVHIAERLGCHVEIRVKRAA